MAANERTRDRAGRRRRVRVRWWPGMVAEGPNEQHPQPAVSTTDAAQLHRSLVALANGLGAQADNAEIEPAAVDVANTPDPAVPAGGEASGEVVSLPAGLGLVATLEPAPEPDPDREPERSRRPEPAPEAEAGGSPEVVESEAVRVRGWAGRGPVGLRMVKPKKWLRQRAGRRQGMWRVWRLATGAEWNGLPRTNATWLRPGSVAYEWSDRLPPRWAAYPRLVRALARWLAVFVGGVVGWCWWRWPTATAVAVFSVGWLVLASLGWAAVDSLLGYGHRRRRVWPAHAVVAPMLGYPERTPPRRYLYVPKGFGKAGGQIEVALPPGWVATAEDDAGKRLATALRRVLCLADVSETWHLDGRNHYLVVRPRFTKPVPQWVRFSELAVREIIESLPDSRLLIGLTSGGEPVTFDLDAENPHAFLPINTGGGKSETLKNFGAQLMHRGADAWIFDYKFTSHDGWARDVATIFRRIEEIHCGLVALGQECQNRSEAALAASEAGQPPPVFQRLAVLLDEAPTAIILLRLWWATHRRQLTEDDIDRYGDPRWTRSPAEVAMFMALSMGRSMLVNVILVSQVANANEIGGSAIRNLLSLRIMGRQPRQAWKMAAPEIEHPPVCSRHLGRLYVVMDGQVFETQGVYYTDTEAREWALAGASRSRGRVVAPDLSPRAAGRDPATASGAQAVIDVAEALITIRQASTDHGGGIVPYTRQTLRKLQASDSTFPTPREKSKKTGEPHRYDPEDLRRWHANRPSRTGVND